MDEWMDGWERTGEEVLDRLVQLLLRWTLVRQPQKRNNLFQGGLVFKAHRFLYHSTLGSRVIKKKKKHDLLPGEDGSP